MKRENLYLSTIDPNAYTLAGASGLGLEIAEFCTAYNMDEHFSEVDAQVRRELDGIHSRILHAPFNELFPCAIDPEARALARRRYTQAIGLAAGYGVSKMVIHGGYNPKLYYPCWYTEQSVPFWLDYLKTLPAGMEICLENVFEEEPGMLLDIVKAVNDPRLRLCLDVGHVNAYSQIPVEEWLEAFAPFLSHFHLHNNTGEFDSHSPLNDGTIPMKALLSRALRLCPEATFTLEVPDARPSLLWLTEEGILKD